MYTCSNPVVKCESGLHNRQATFFIQKANEFTFQHLGRGRRPEDQCQEPARRAFHGHHQGDPAVSMIAEGPDEEEAVKALTEMLVKEIF